MNCRGRPLFFVVKQNSPKVRPCVDRSVNTVQCLSGRGLDSAACAAWSWIMSGVVSGAAIITRLRAAHENKPVRNLIFSFHICFLLFTARWLSRSPLRSSPMHCFGTPFLRRFLKVFPTLVWESAESSKHRKMGNYTLLKQVLMYLTLQVIMHTVQ